MPNETADTFHGLRLNVSEVLWGKRINGTREFSFAGPPDVHGCAFTFTLKLRSRTSRRIPPFISLQCVTPQEAEKKLKRRLVHDTRRAYTLPLKS